MPSLANGAARRKAARCGRPTEASKLVETTCLKEAQTLTITRFRFVRISHIDLKDQSFRAQFIVDLRFKGGANDPYLRNVDEVKISKDEASQKLHASSKWFANQLSIKNFVEEQAPLDDNVHVATDGTNDVLISRRYHGIFFEVFEMDDFPFDKQELSIYLAINCQPVGKFPCILEVDEDADFSISKSGFRSCTQEYELDDRLTSTIIPVKAPDDLYPTIKISARIYRDPMYIILNLMVPMVLFLFLQLLQFCVPTGDQEVRLAVTLTVLLTANAYKTVTMDMTPRVSYLTFIDRYMHFVSYIMIITVAEGAIVGQVTYLSNRRHGQLDGPRPLFFFDLTAITNMTVTTEATIPSSFPAWVDFISLLVILLAILLLHIWFGLKVAYIKRVRRLIDRSECQVHGLQKGTWRQRFLARAEPGNLVRKSLIKRLSQMSGPRNPKKREALRATIREASDQRSLAGCGQRPASGRGSASVMPEDAVPAAAPAAAPASATAHAEAVRKRVPAVQEEKEGE